MRFKYAAGLLFSNAFRLLGVFPNSDPIMGFVLPAAKNEPFWKAPLFAFVAMFTFDVFTSGIGLWTWVTSATYAAIALAFTFYFRGRKAGLGPYMKAGFWGVLAFDFITGPLMSSILFGQGFFATTLLQIPFTAMHLVSATFGIMVITPFLDKEAAKDADTLLSAARNRVLSWRPEL